MNNTKSIGDKLADIIQEVMPLANSQSAISKPVPIMYTLAHTTLRRNIMRAQAVNLLSIDTKLSGAALEIARNMIEDSVSLDYILSHKNPEKVTEKLFDFRWLQLKEDREYYESLGLKTFDEDFPNVESLIDQQYDAVTKRHRSFLYRDGSPKRNWGHSVEQMLEAIRKTKKFDGNTLDNMARIYVRGSRKSHLNAVDLLTYLDQLGWDEESSEIQRMSLLAAASCLVRITTRYRDTLSHYAGKRAHEDVGRTLDALLEEIHKLHT